jgi:hypothetical protein
MRPHSGHFKSSLGLSGTPEGLLKHRDGRNNCGLSAGAADRRCFYHVFVVVVVIRYETTATARWALLFIIRATFNDTITVAVRAGFHVHLMGKLTDAPMVAVLFGSVSLLRF